MYVFILVYCKVIESGDYKCQVVSTRTESEKACLESQAHAPKMDLGSDFSVSFCHPSKRGI